MMKLSRVEVAKKEEFARQLEEARLKLEDTIDAFNEKVTSEFRAVDVVQKEYNALIAKAKAFVDEVVASTEKEFKGKKKGWRDSTLGESAREWMDKWNDVNLFDSTLSEPSIYWDANEADKIFKELPDEQ